MPFFLLLVLLFSCAKKSTMEAREDAILSANIHLDKNHCDEAIRVLDSAGRDYTDPRYTQTLASAYACKANFKLPKFFADDLPLFGTPAVLGGAARFSTSKTMDIYDHEDFTHLMSAIDILLYAGNLDRNFNPSVSKRLEKINPDDAGDINMFLLFSLMGAIGKYIYYYGNSSTAGVKGAGAQVNTCFLNYENLNLAGGITLHQLIGLGQTGSCTAGETGHIYLGETASINIERTCQGIILLNNLFDVLPGTLSSVSSADFDVIDDLFDGINTAKLLALGASGDDPRMQAVLDVTSLTRCISENEDNDDFIQIYFVYLFEALFV